MQITAVKTSIEHYSVIFIAIFTPPKIDWMNKQTNWFLEGKHIVQNAIFGCTIERKNIFCWLTTHFTCDAAEEEAAAAFESQYKHNFLDSVDAFKLYEFITVWLNAIQNFTPNRYKIQIYIAIDAIQFVTESIEIELKRQSRRVRDCIQKDMELVIMIEEYELSVDERCAIEQPQTK